MLNDTHTRSRMVRTRTRMLTFRVTEEEFESLQTASNVSGARCLSDFLREAVLQGLAQGSDRSRLANGHPITGHPWVAQLILSLEERVNHLETRISGVMASPTSGPKLVRE